jgi:transcriptional regulator with XRE-family HTH domain
MDVSKLQQELFQAIKASIPGSVSVTEEIAKVLDVSVDSVYRRMRGEKTISLDELHTLCAHYKISLDNALNIQTGAFSFEGKLIDKTTFNYHDWWAGVLKMLIYFNSFKEKKFYFICKDIPPFHHFIFREIAAFKYYFWMKTMYHFPEFSNQKISLDTYPDELFSLGKKTLDLYNQLSLVEFWNIESINSTIRQIDYYRDAQMFQSNDDIIRIYDAFLNLIEHLQTQAALGHTYNYGDPEKKPISDYQVYYNEVIIGDNHMLAVMDGMKISLISHTVINYMITRDIVFNENMYEHVQNLMKKSTRISSVSEKERTRFYKILRDRIARRKESLKA